VASSSYLDGTHISVFCMENGWFSWWY